MINQQLLDFIKLQLSKGVDKETITRELLGSGWAEQDIQDGFNTVNTPVVNQTINPIINPSINSVISKNYNNKIISTNKKYSLKKKIFLIIFATLCVYGFLKLRFIMYTPLLETCIQSDILAQDKISNNFIKYIECMKGYTIKALPDGGYNMISQRTSGYVIFDKNGNYISTTPIEKHSNNDFRQGVSPDFYFKDKNLFVTINDSSDTIKMSKYDSKLLSFENDKINKIRDISFQRQYVIAYENNQIYYLDFGNQTIIRENLLTGESTIVIDLNNIKRDSFYNLIYDLNGYKDGDRLMASFLVIVSVDEKTQKQTKEHYLIDLSSGKLSKIGYNNITPNLDVYPNRVEYSKIEGNASTYNLKYDPNSQMGIYKLLLFLKKGISAGLPRVIG